MSAREVSWTKMFAYAPATSAPSKAKKCTCGNGNCRTAKKILCTCGCHSMNHGAANREGVPKLDELLDLDGLEIGVPPIPWLEVW